MDLLLPYRLIIFDDLTGLDEKISEIIFKCIRSDRTQREVTLELARAKLEETSRTFCALQDAFKQLGDLAAERNVIAHDSFALHVDRDWNAEMKPMSDDHAWNVGSAEKRLDALIDKLCRIDRELFDISCTISEELNKTGVVSVGKN